jgi:hypothetical protein
LRSCTKSSIMIRGNRRNVLMTLVTGSSGSEVGSMSELFSGRPESSRILSLISRRGLAIEWIWSPSQCSYIKSRLHVDTYSGRWSGCDAIVPRRRPDVTGVLASAGTTRQDKARQGKALELQFNSISFVSGYLTAALRTRASGSFE